MMQNIQTRQLLKNPHDANQQRQNQLLMGGCSRSQQENQQENHGFDAVGGFDAVRGGFDAVRGGGFDAVRAGVAVSMPSVVAEPTQSVSV